MDPFSPFLSTLSNDQKGLKVLMVFHQDGGNTSQEGQILPISSEDFGHEDSKVHISGEQLMLSSWSSSLTALLDCHTVVLVSDLRYGFSIVYQFTCPLSFYTPPRLLSSFILALLIVPSVSGSAEQSSIGTGVEIFQNLIRIRTPPLPVQQVKFGENWWLPAIVYGSAGCPVQRDPG